MWLSRLILVTCLGVINAIDTFFMDEYCGSTLYLIDLDEYNGRLSMDASYVGDCNVTIEAWFTSNRIALHFDDFSLGLKQANCPDTFLTVYDGQYPETSPRMHGLHKVCGSTKPNGNHASKSRYITVRYFNTDTTNNNHFEMIFTTFHKGYCYSYEYECSNGRCIDDSVNCNGYNPCGDGSDCRLSAGAIVGIVLGAIFCVCVCSAIAYVVVKNRRGKRVQESGYTNVPPTIDPPAYEATPSTMIRAASPMPNYGMTQQYSSATVFQAPTSIQDDGK